MTSYLTWPSGVLSTRSESLPRLLHDTSHNTTSFGHSLKTFFSLRVGPTSTYCALGAFGDHALYKSAFYLRIVTLLCHLTVCAVHILVVW